MQTVTANCFRRQLLLLLSRQTGVNAHIPAERRG